MTHASVDTRTSRATPAGPEKGAGPCRLGRFKVLCAFFGGLSVAYSGMILMALITPADLGTSMLVPFLFTPFAWSLSGLWVSLAPTRRSALIRSALPTGLFTLGITFFSLQA